ncbi:helix-turn-helix transcriptional regulator [Streptomyces olivoreticuli]|uniref:helix-turn-helix transcriptional regulator n=1 Tax=Streptomyces sp. UNOC14_S4 TaxID=2872340 RepID=UPI001E59390E|nr:helix-turn-helix transcriptional regulator [Streptomyces sp. UNOC14_S4]MCC3770634.1 helix-turn-helix domain-containing protein [Streptomyces sp. UNOC14_S4]
MSSEEGAARAGPERPLPENNVAERIKLEREFRGWSTQKLAERMAEVGHPVNQAAIWRIESGKPRRRVNLDEALGFCKVFDIPLDDLASPPGHVSNAEVRRLVGEYVERWKDWRAVRKPLDRAKADIDDYIKAHPDQEEMVKGLLTYELAGAAGNDFTRYDSVPARHRSLLGDAAPAKPVTE